MPQALQTDTELIETLFEECRSRRRLHDAESAAVWLLWREKVGLRSVQLRSAAALKVQSLYRGHGGMCVRPLAAVVSSSGAVLRIAIGR